jgi:pantoate--beta-alanine ligase
MCILRASAVTQGKKMEIIYHRSELAGRSRLWKDQNLSVGFTPTMGALHEGHISLLKMSKSGADISVASIFVNPTQFNDPRDFEKYPSSIDADLEMLLKAGCDAVFMPDVADIYPDNAPPTEPVDLGYIGTCLEAARRPGHFEGVVQVVDILLSTLMPDKLFLGAKDYQQVMVIKKLIDARVWPITVITGPTIREADGLAMSSRNRRLSTTQRREAPQFYQALSAMKEQLGHEEPGILTKSYIDLLNQISDVRVDYLEIVDSQTLIPLKNWNPAGRNLACLAAYMGDIRLIDNLLF